MGETDSDGHARIHTCNQKQACRQRYKAHAQTCSSRERAQRKKKTIINVKGSTLQKNAVNETGSKKKRGEGEKKRKKRCHASSCFATLAKRLCVPKSRKKKKNRGTSHSISPLAAAITTDVSNHDKEKSEYESSTKA